VIVEFIGPSGAGKTTIARSLVSSDDGSIIMQSDLLMAVPGLRWIRDPHVTNVVADIRSLVPFWSRLEENRAFVDYAFERLRAHAKYNYMRNMVRKLGILQLSRQKAEKAIVLTDEGTILTAYQLFVYSDAAFGDSDLAEFAKVVPLPDRIVYVRAPLEVLTQRATGRPDVRRELAGLDDLAVEGALRRAVKLFDGLVTTEPLRRRTLVIEVDDSTDALRAATKRVAAFIREPTEIHSNSSEPPPDGNAG
jgi:hypothetical protein